VLQFLAVLFTLSALAFVFLVTLQTQNQTILQSVAESNQGANYPALSWTPETWFKAVLDVPLADRDQYDTIAAQVVNMVVWRWMLVPIAVVDMVALGATAVALLKQKNGALQPEFTMEK
jgi:hypothetical protein